MKRILFASDLDNTLLYSHRHAAPGDVCVEWLDGKEQGFFSPQTIMLLRDVCRQTMFVPITTRSVAQYQRIEWPAGCAPACAITTNGAILLTPAGEKDDTWEAAMAPILAAAHEELQTLCAAHRCDTRYRICRMVDEAYLFLLPADDGDHDACMQALAAETRLPIAASGRKIYILPHQLDKGQALRQLQSRLGANTVFAAGDSAMDLPMLTAADQAFTLPGLAAPHAAYFSEDTARVTRFAEWTLAHVLARL